MTCRFTIRKLYASCCRKIDPSEHEADVGMDVRAATINHLDGILCQLCIDGADLHFRNRQRVEKTTAKSFPQRETPNVTCDSEV